MTTTTVQDAMLAQDLANARDLAVEAGSALTRRRDRDTPEVILIKAVPILEWLCAGPGTSEDHRDRRRAVQHHLRNLMAATRENPRPAGLGVQQFLSCAAQYYEMLTGTRP